MRLPQWPVWKSSVAIIAPATPTPIARLPTDAAQTAAASQTSATRLRWRARTNSSTDQSMAARNGTSVMKVGDRMKKTG